MKRHSNLLCVDTNCCTRFKWFSKLAFLYILVPIVTGLFFSLSAELVLRVLRPITVLFVADAVGHVTGLGRALFFRRRTVRTFSRCSATSMHLHEMPEMKRINSRCFSFNTRIRFPMFSSPLSSFNFRSVDRPVEAT